MASNIRTDNEIAAKSGLTVPGVRARRKKGWSDDEIIAGVLGFGKTGEDMTDAQLRKEIALADLRQLEVAEKSGELIPLAAERAATAVMGQMTRAKFLAMPDALCDQLAAYTDAGEVRAFLRREIEERLTQIADEFSETARGLMGDSGDGDTTTGTPDGDGVGEEVPGTVE